MKNHLINSKLWLEDVLNSIEEKNITIVNSEINRSSISIREIIENSITLKNKENKWTINWKNFLKDDIRVPKKIVKWETKKIYYKSEEIEISQALFEEIAKNLNLVYMQIWMDSPIAVLSRFREDKNKDEQKKLWKNQWWSKIA